MEASNELISKDIYRQQDSINHHIGTTRMSENSSYGIVDKNHKIFGLNNVYITGSSVFPTSSCVNPTLTIIALSLRLGDYLNNSVGKKYE